MEWLWGTAWDAGDEAAVMVVKLFIILAIPVLITCLVWVVIGKIRGRE